MADEVMHMETVTKSFVTWEKGFGGHATELTIKRYDRWSEVILKGGGFKGEWEHIIHSCPVDVLRKIVAMHDALPPIPASVLMKSADSQEKKR